MTALKITSCLSVAAAFIIIYSLINEMQDGASFSEIAFLPFLILIAVLANAVMAVLFFSRKNKADKGIPYYPDFYLDAYRLHNISDFI